VKQAVDYVQAQLARESVSKSSGVAMSGLGADENFAVLKRDYVGWPRFVHELSMQRRHSTVRDNRHRNLTQLDEICLFLARNSKTNLKCLSRELLKINSVHRHFALEITDSDFWDRRVNLAFHRDRRPLSNCLRSA
jgi:hypothetical protein